MTLYRILDVTRRSDHKVVHWQDVTGQDEEKAASALETRFSPKEFDYHVGYCSNPDTIYGFTNNPGDRTGKVSGSVNKIDRKESLFDDDSPASKEETDMADLNLQSAEKTLVEKYGFLVSMTDDKYVVRHPKIKRWSIEGKDLLTMLQDGAARVEAIDKGRATLGKMSSHVPDNVAAEAKKLGVVIRKEQDEFVAATAKLPGKEFSSSSAKGALLACSKALNPEPPASAPDKTEDHTPAPKAEDTVHQPEPVSDKRRKANGAAAGTPARMAAGANAAETRRRKREQSSAPKGKAEGKRNPEDWTTGRVGMLILKNPDKTADEIFALCEAEGIKTKQMTVVGLKRYFTLCITLLARLQEEKAAAAAE